MGVQTLQKFAEKGSIEGIAESVELSQVSRVLLNSRPKPTKPLPLATSNRLCLVLDAECCLDRLYGGFFSDWTCGGQWNRMVQFLNQFFGACQKGNIELTVAFNGALEQQRLVEWSQRQQNHRQNVQMVLRHIQNKGTPPPKVWWVPPTCLSTALRLALRYLGIPMMCSMDDHHQEVLAYCRENNLHGIMGDDAEYLVFDPPRYFSANGIKLTFKGFIETKELFVSKLSEALGLDCLGLCILTTLLGNYLLTEALLTTLHAKLKINTIKDANEAVPILAEYVKNLENLENLENLAVEIFGNEKGEKVGKRRQLFVESVQYYLNGTKDGFLKYKPRKFSRKKATSPKKDGTNGEGEVKVSSDGHHDLDESRFASETAELEAGSLQAYAQLAENQRGSSQFLMGEREEASLAAATEALSIGSISGISFFPSGPTGINGGLSSAALDANGAYQPTPGPSQRDGQRGKRLPIPPEVIRTAGERHQKGVMSPTIYQILTQNEIKLPVLLEDEHMREIPSVHHIYQPVRQSIYAILFNVHHQQYIIAKEQEPGEKVPLELPVIKEWTFPYIHPETVRAEPISWSVPTVQRLWFGTNIEDMRRRLRAYLTCMKSDSPLMVASAYVPQHLLVMASVLRYLMQSPVPILRQLELDAFIVTAFCPDLMDSEYTQELQLPMVTARGVHLATLFMQGVETAVLANEACGAPIPYLMCCPWLFFDGKLFHNILAKTEFVKSLQELCNHRMDVLVKVERMRHAILENLHVQYARRGINNIGNTVLPYPSAGLMPSSYNNSVDRRPAVVRGNQRRQVSARGGQLQVAGVVVCSWGPNYSLARDRNQHQVGGMGGGRGYNRNYVLERQNYGPPGHPGQAGHPGLGYPVRGLGRGRRGNPRGRSKGRKPGDRRRGSGRGVVGNAESSNNQPEHSGSSGSDDADVASSCDESTPPPGLYANMPGLDGQSSHA